MEWSSSISLNSLNRSDSVVETKKEFKIYPSSVKSGHVWSFLQAGKIDPSHPLEISRFCPTTGENKTCLVLFTIINPSLIKLDRSGGGREEEGQIRKACWVWRPRGRLWGTQLVSYIYPNLKWLQGGSVAEWSARWTRNPSFPGSVLGLPEFKSSATLVNRQPVASRQLGFLILLWYV